MNPVPDTLETTIDVVVPFADWSEIRGVVIARGPSSRAIIADLRESEPRALAEWVSRLGAGELLQIERVETEAETRISAVLSGQSGVDPLMGESDVLHIPTATAFLGLPLGPSPRLAATLPRMRVTWTLRLHLPDGITADEPPPPTRAAAGALVCTVQGSEVVLGVTFDTTARATAHQAESLLRWAREAADGVELTTRYAPLRLLDDGDPVGAMALATRLADGHPDEVSQQGLRAVVMARLGQREGAIARLEASAERGPAWHYWRAQLRLHDEVGGFGLRGMLHDGAIDDLEVAAADGYGEADHELAWTCHLGSTGAPMGPGARPERVLELVENLNMDDDRVLTWATLALVALGRDAQALDLDADGGATLAARAAATAATRGVRAARTLARSEAPDPKAAANALAKAYWILARRGERKLAEAILADAAVVAGQPRDALFAYIGRLAAIPPTPAGTPITAFADLVHAVLRNDELALARRIAPGAADPRQWLAPLVHEVAERGVQVLAELAHGSAAVWGEIPGRAARVSASVLMSEFTAVFVHDGDTWRFLGSSDEAWPFARRALAALDAAAADEARVWAGWMVDTFEGLGFTSPEGRQMPALDRVLGQADDPGPRTDAGRAWRVATLEDPADLRALAATFARDPQAQPSARGPELLHHLRRALVDEHLALGLGREALAALDALEDTGPRAACERIRVLVQGGALEEARSSLDEACRRWPDSLEVAVRRMRTLRRLQAASDDELLSATRAVASRLGESNEAVVNDVAWGLVCGGVGDVAAALAVCVRLDRASQRSLGVLNTIAVCRAEAGDVNGALATWQRAAALGALDTASSGWDVVRARIAEEVGLRDLARASYEAIGGVETDGTLCVLCRRGVSRCSD